MRVFPVILVVALIEVGVQAQAPDPLAPLTPEEGKEGTREAYVTFSYQKTVEEQSHTEGGKDGVGEDKMRGRVTTRCRGQAMIVVPDRNYLDLRILKYESPDGKTRELAYPERLHVLWNSEDPVRDLGVKSCSLRTQVGGQRVQERLAMNAWGRPEPKWHREITDFSGSNLLNWTGAGSARNDRFNSLQLTISSDDPEASFSFSVRTGCEVTEDRCSIPPRWPDPHYRDNRPTHRIQKSSGAVDVNLIAWAQEKAAPEHARTGWTRQVSRGKSGLTVKATRDKTIKAPPNGKFLGSSTRTEEKLSIQVDLEAADYEIVITPPEGIKDWIPSGGLNLRAPGDKLNFKGRIKRTKAAAAADREVEVRVELSSSRVPGRCMNWPPKGDREPDLRILRAGTTDKLKIEQPVLEGDDHAIHEAHGVFKPDEEFNIAVGCYDYGAYGGISFGGSVPVRIEGYEPRLHIELPEDENDNRVADAWERGESVYDRNLPADWDEVEVPGQRNNGDGICLYERCRGFRNSFGAHTRLECDRKYLFIFDPMNMLRGYGVSHEFMEASQLTPIFIKEDQWTGPGSHTNDKRIVNFNHPGQKGAGPLHRVDQHALHIVRDDRRQSLGKDVAEPDEWAKVYQKAGLAPPPPEGDSVTLGYAWPDALPAGRLGRSPLDKFQVSIYVTTIGDHLWKQGVLAMPGATVAQKVEAAEAYDKAHKGQYEQQRDRLIGWTLCHELGHCVGAQHHVPVHGGDTTCFMRISAREGDDPTDPFWSRYTFPTTFCRGGGGGIRSTSYCFQHIQVTDHRERR